MIPRTDVRDVTGLIGNTPLLRVRLFEREFPGLEVYAKAEWFNPGGSVKDRAALAMIEDGERRPRRSSTPPRATPALPMRWSRPPRVTG